MIVSLSLAEALSLITPGLSLRNFHRVTNPEKTPRQENENISKSSKQDEFILCICLRESLNEALSRSQTCIFQSTPEPNEIKV